MSEKLDRLYMEMATSMSTISYGVRAKVGAILVTENGVVLTGVNGLPKALGNVLEHICVSDSQDDYVLKTKETVIHAELNCILKAAREGVSTINSTVYVTMSPCPQCAAMLVSAGVKRVVFKDIYRNDSGIAVLIDCGVRVENYSEVLNEI